MNSSFDLEPVKEALKNSKSVLILIAQQPQIDEAAGALALFLALQKMGLSCLIACPTTMTVVFNRLFGVNKITDKIGSRNLVVSFDYVKDAIEKVSYNIENAKFNLVIEPKSGSPALDHKKVTYSYAGADADLVFICGAQQLADLGVFALSEKKLFKEKPVVNISHKQTTDHFGKMNLTNPEAASFSEVMTDLFQELELPIDQDIATNLMAGIEAGSLNFSSNKTNAKTLRAAAFLLDKGAKKNYLRVLTRPAVSPASIGLTPAIQPSPVQNQTVGQSQVSKPAQPSPDWYQPKVYKGNTQF